MAVGGEGPFNFIGNTMSEWKMKQILRLLEAGGKITVTIEIPQKGETTEETDANEYRAGAAGAEPDGTDDNTGGTDGGAASE